MVGCGSGKQSATTSERGIAPILYANHYTCPRGHLVSTYGHIVYPPESPYAQKKLGERPSRCFTSVRQAERAGFRVAALPHGDREIDGVYLIAAPAGVHAYCKRAAQRFKRTILCPRLLPASLTPGTCEGPGCFFRGRFIIDGNFPAPSNYVGLGRGGGHLSIWSGPAVLLREGDLGCPWARARTPVTFSGRRAEWIACPTGSAVNSGHVILQWQQQGVVTGVSLHGHTALNKRLVITIAANLQPVSPR